MKTITAISIFILLAFTKSFAQSMSCQELFTIVTTEYDRKDQRHCVLSDMLVKVTRYEIEDMGFVVAYIKSGDYDFSGSPYIFCDISTYTWSQFNTAAIYDGWGNAFHKYIFNQTCNCY